MERHELITEILKLTGHKRSLHPNVHFDIDRLLDKYEQSIEQIDVDTNVNVPYYDSTNDTLRHIKRVSELLTECSIELIERANRHDNSKLKSPEKELFDEYTPKLKECTYGSDEYKEYLKGLKIALDHHYENNSHHPEHYENGVDDFDLFDLVEMFMDWKAATERHANGNIFKSITINKERFDLDDQICNIFENTAHRLNW